MAGGTAGDNTTQDPMPKMPGTKAGMINAMYNEMNSWYELELQNEKYESMLTVYQDHIEELEKENKELLEQVAFLEEQLDYQSHGLPQDD